MMLLFLLSILPPAVSGLDNGAALTPPMGFNNYMAYPSSESGLLRAASFLADSGLRDLGYVYVNTDEGWELRDRDNETGELRWDPRLYPGGIPALADRLHGMGLGFGVYGAASGVTCGERPGQLYSEGLDAGTYADWGVDFVKSDNCATYALDPSVRYGALRDALNRTGRRMVLSIGPFSMTPDPAVSTEVSNMWRTGVDISGDLPSILDRADVADKWAPLAGPGGWNDPDMINVQNPPPAGGLMLGENRLYFGLWAIMKAPLLLSADLPDLSSDVMDIISNPEVIAVNQDPLGVQARKVQVDGEPLPWLVGTEDCSPPEGARTYARPVAQDSDGRPAAGPGRIDTRLWTLLSGANRTRYQLRNDATGRCLAVGGDGRVVLLPCDSARPNRLWVFDKGVTTVGGITNVAAGKALAVPDAVLYGRAHGADALNVTDMAYGEPGLVLVDPYDQDSCDSRSCENYEPGQMWYYSSADGMLRNALYSSSMNHRERGDGYVLTPRVPTFRRNCLAHVLSPGNAGTDSSDAEVWGGPLSGGDLIVGFANRGPADANVTADLGLLMESSGGRVVRGGGGGEGRRRDAFDGLQARDLWKRRDLGEVGGDTVTVKVAACDLVLLRLSEKRSMKSSG